MTNINSLNHSKLKVREPKIRTSTLSHSMIIAVQSNMTQEFLTPSILNKKGSFKTNSKQHFKAIESQKRETTG